MQTTSLLLAAILVIPGILLLVAGVSLYDTAIMVVGFFIGAGIAGSGAIATGLTESTVGLAAAAFLVLVIGFIAAYLAIAFHHLLIVGLGFIGGAVLALTLLQGAGIPATPTGALAGGTAPTTADITGIAALVIGGILGASIGWVLFRAFVIVITAVIGAGLITTGITTVTHDPGEPVTLQTLSEQPELALMGDGLLFTGLVLFGILVQGLQALRTRRTEHRAARSSRYRNRRRGRR